MACPHYPGLLTHKKKKKKKTLPATDRIERKAVEKRGGQVSSKTFSVKKKGKNRCFIEFMCVMMSEISSSSDSQAGCMQILSKDGEMGGREGREGVPL